MSTKYNTFKNDVMCQCHPTLNHVVSAFKTKVNVKNNQNYKNEIDHWDKARTVLIYIKLSFSCN